MVVSEKNSEKPEEPVVFYQEKAKQYFKANFPDLEVSENILALVGILGGHKGKLDRAEYHEYLGRKYCVSEGRWLIVHR